MANKPRLATVHGEPVDPDKPPALWQGDDPVFFNRHQLEPGTRLIYFGRRNHGELWEVVEFKTFRVTASGRTLSRAVQAIVHPSYDEVVIRRVGQGSNVYKQVSFYRLSYAAHWRLA